MTHTPTPAEEAYRQIEEALSEAEYRFTLFGGCGALTATSKEEAAALSEMTFHALEPIKQALAALPALKPQPAAGWQPIETAPMTGERVVLADADGWVGEGQYEHDEGWYAANCCSTDYVDRKLYPTRWQPLPTPPEGEQP